MAVPIISDRLSRMKPHLSLIFMTIMIFVSSADDKLATQHKHQLGEIFGDISTCSVKYVHPGDDFDIRCTSDHSLWTRVGFVHSVSSTVNMSV